MTAPTVRDVRPDDPDVARLLAQFGVELAQRYGELDEAELSTSPMQFEPPDGRFLVLELDGRVVATGGVRRHGRQTAELKRCYVVPAERRRGHSRRLLVALEDAARELGYRRLRLETGTQQPEAIALYTSAGYIRIANYGDYAEYDASRCYEREL